MLQTEFNLDFMSVILLNMSVSHDPKNSQVLLQYIEVCLLTF